MDNRFNIINESKFETLDQSEMELIQGGLCISCKKKERKVEIGIEIDITINSTENPEGEKDITIKIE